MRKLSCFLALLVCLLPLSTAESQTPMAIYCYQGATAPQWVPCSSSFPLSVSLTTGGATEDVNLKQIGGNTLTTTLPVSGTVAATQSGTWNVGTVTAVTAISNALPAGTALLGKVGIDQTTNGTTNAVSFTGYSFANITTSTTTTVKSGAGVLHIVNINTKGTVASTTTIYDNTAGSGSKIGIIDSLTLAGAFQYDIAFATGLTLVTTGTVAPDLTVSYR